jgi:drug/metabolite transporter (DMT)-like permease
MALLGGFLAAVCFAVSSLCASAATRAVGPAITLAGIMAIGLILVVPPELLLADAGQLSLSTVGLLAVIGISNVAGLRIEYLALRRGKVGVVVAVISTDGAVAALIAVLFGLHLAAHTALLLLLISVGVVFAAATPDPPDREDSGQGLRSGVLALGAALLFGVNLYVTGHVGSTVSVLWVLLPARLVGTAVVAVPLAARGVSLPRGKVLALLATAGVAEVLGIISYTLGARHELAVAAVIVSQFAALTTVGAYFFFGERLNRAQIAGLVTVAVGVGLLAGTGG